MIFPQEDPQDKSDNDDNIKDQRSATTTEMIKMSNSDMLESKLPDEDHLRRMVMDSEAIEDVLAKSLEQSMREKKEEHGASEIDPNNPDIS